MRKPNITSSGIRDNRNRGKVGDFIYNNLQQGTSLSVVSAYFTIYAYGRLKEKLNEIKNLRFLFGEPKFLGDISGNDKESKSFELTEQNLELRNQLQQKQLARECADWIKEKVEVRSVKQAGLLHGKMYHMENGCDNRALLGSSNFTVAGLGLGGTRSNVELNLIVNDERDRSDLMSWFNEWWSDKKLTEDVKDDVLKELDRIYANQSPEFIYYLTLYHIFRDYLDADHFSKNAEEDKMSFDKGIWKALYEFQKDGAKATINKLLALNGCILADSVGLGKTYTALAVIKYFESRNERVLVLCPRRLRHNWTVYRENSTMNPFPEDRFRYDVLSHTDLSRTDGRAGDIDLATLNWSNYDLLVIDESHHFRNNMPARQESGKPLKKTRYQKLMDDIVRSGVNTKVLLLSATPVNNDLSDLRNQVSLIVGGDVKTDQKSDSMFSQSLEIRSITETINLAQKQFSEWIQKSPKNKINQTLLENINGNFFRLLDGLSIARSRKQIQHYYEHEMDKLGGFPARTAPKSLHPNLDNQNDNMSFQSLDIKISDLSLAIYNPTKYLRENLRQEIRRGYLREISSGFDQKAREKTLINMMKVNLFKRLESSVYSFCKTLERMIGKIDDLDMRFERYQELEEEDYELLDDDEFDEDDLMVGEKLKIRFEHIDIPKWRNAMRGDRKQLQELLESTEVINHARDGKLSILFEQIKDKLNNPTLTKDGHKNHKVLVFTAFADTANYLYEYLQGCLKGQTHIALVCGTGKNQSTLGKADYDEILTNFSPISKKRKQQKRFALEEQKNEEIDVLIATDCISEGQNLQDCDLLINYDIHWNPVRIVQRFGRIDRIGSQNKEVHLTNFWPVEQLDEYLNLKVRVEDRMALVDLSATQTDNYLRTQTESEINDSDFRNRQLRQMQNQILDLEDLDGNVTLSDFSLEEFRLDLLHFLETRRKELESASLGLYAVAPTPMQQSKNVDPGVLFCLRHKPQGTDLETRNNPKKDINPLGDYYLLYLLDSGSVKLKSIQPKQVLNLWQRLSINHKSALNDLCDIFDQNTNDGVDMEHYHGLLTKALESISNIHRERTFQNLRQKRGAVIPTQSEHPSSRGQDYELVTWLAILERP